MKSEEIKRINKIWARTTPYREVTVRRKDGTTRRKLMTDHDIDRWMSIDPDYIVSIDSECLTNEEASERIKGAL